MRVSCFGGHQEQQKKSAIGTEFIHAKMEELMVLPGSFHYAGYVGELDIRTGEMRKSMALREDSRRFFYFFRGFL